MKTLIAFLSASSLAACCASGPNCPPCTSGPNCPPHRVEPGGVPQPDFWAKPEWPHDHELCCTIVDRFAEPDEDMKAGEGDAGPGQTANWLTDKTHNALLMTLLAPEHPLTDGDVARTASMGAFKTGLPFGPDGSFSVIATFQMPVGDLLGGSWSMAVVARTGDAEDKSDLERLQVSLRANGGAVEMRVQEGANAAKTQKIKGASVPITVAAFQDIYKSPLPFTVQLNVDRKTGKGSAILTTANTRNEIDFQTLQFAHDKPEKVSTVGATLANTNPGQTVSVQLTDFKIWTY